MSEPCLSTLFEHAVRVHSCSIACAGDLADDARECDYAQLDQRVRRRAAALMELGVRPATPVVLIADNGAPYLELTFAAALVGAVLVPTNTRLAAPEVAYSIDDCEAGLVLHDAASRVLAQKACEHSRTRPPAHAIEALKAAMPYPGAHRGAGDELCQLYYTSGTTGRPKGVMLTQRNVCQHALMAIAELGLCATDTWAHVAPMFHLADAWATLAVTWVGGRHVFLPRFEARTALDLFEQHDVTISNLVPTMLNLMVRHESSAARKFPHLRRILSGGAPIAPEVVRAIEAVFGAEYVQTYGMTETSPYLTMSLLSRAERALPQEQQTQRRARTGRAVLGIELDVVDSADQPVARDDCAIGEIRVRGETVTAGYWKRPEETASALRDGWLYTGDLARIDGSGSVQIVDRKKDMILTGGENVYSIEVEAVLYEHPGVLEAAVFGRADEIYGERVCAAVVARPDHDLCEQELLAFCRTRLAGFKCPRVWIFLAALPRTGSGKIAKRLIDVAS